MKKILLFALASTVILASCNQEDNGIDGAPIVDNGNAVKVELNTNLPSVITKATLEDANWQGTEVGIYAAPKSGNVADADCFILNQKATINNGIAFAADIYYPAENKTAYSFYGYYPYGTPAISGNVCTIEYTIDGTQDILSGKSVVSTENETAVGTSGYTAKYMRELAKYNADEANKDKQIAGPSITFDHKLTRLMFQVKDGNAVGETTSKQTIKSIKLTNVTNKLQLTVFNNTDATKAGELVAIAGNKGDFDLKDKDGNIITSLDVEKGEYKIIGDGIMFLPESSTKEYFVTAVFVDGATGKEYTCANLPITTKDGSAFAIGTSYTVSMIVYGPGMVKIDATLTGWGDGETNGEHEIN